MSRTNSDRTYPPTFVSKETLAYLLDCSMTTIDKYVEQKLLPPGKLIGGLRRWHWPAIEQGLAQDGFSRFNADQDEFVNGVSRVRAQKTSRAGTS